VSPVIDLEDVRFAWPGRHAFALSVERFVVEAGQKLLLVGPSGSGKSTLLSLISGIVVPASGRVRIVGTELSGLRSAARDAFRAAHLGIIFQMFNLVPYLSVLDNVLLPISFAPARRARALASGGTVAGEARRLLEHLGLDAEQVASQPAATLSVGQQQRAAAARALIGTPEIVIADEPTSALDRDRQEDFLSLLFGEVARVGATLVMVSHDQSLAPRFDAVVEIAAIARITPGAPGLQ
jgi:putative ABC transport system ATP-binding protein